jgi:hypothetical protein
MLRPLTLDVHHSPAMAPFENGNRIELSLGSERLFYDESAPTQCRYGVSVLVAPSIVETCCKQPQLPASAGSVSGNNLLFIPQRLGSLGLGRARALS